MCVTFLHKTVVPVDTGRKLNVHKTSRTSSERLMYVQFTSCLLAYSQWLVRIIIFFKVMNYQYHHQSNIQITYSDVYALQKKKKRILLRISSVFCAVSFIKDNHNRLGFSMEHFAQIYLLSHEIYTNRLIMCVNLFHFQDRIFRQDPI